MTCDWAAGTSRSKRSAARRRRWPWSWPERTTRAVYSDCLSSCTALLVNGHARASQAGIHPGDSGRRLKLVVSLESLAHRSNPCASFHGTGSFRRPGLSIGFDRTGACVWNAVTAPRTGSLRNPSNARWYSPAPGQPRQCTHRAALTRPGRLSASDGHRFVRYEPIRRNNWHPTLLAASLREPRRGNGEPEDDGV